jgi:hypothetical protein
MPAQISLWAGDWWGAAAMPLLSADNVSADDLARKHHLGRERQECEGNTLAS